MVVEVLSPGAELKDRTWKLQNYTAHPTIEEYMLVSARSLKIELYRKEQNKWVYYAFGPDEDIDLACLSVHFPVTDAYEGINPEEDFSKRDENDTFPGE
ncbi:MAG: Uma2 family endonuclease [Ktedonobacteraceae bacterium]